MDAAEYGPGLRPHDWLSSPAMRSATRPWPGGVVAAWSSTAACRSRSRSASAPKHGEAAASRPKSPMITAFVRITSSPPALETGPREWGKATVVPGDADGWDGPELAGTPGTVRHVRCGPDTKIPDSPRPGVGLPA